MSTDKKTVILQGVPADTLNEKIFRHVAVGVGVAIVSFLVDVYLYSKKTK